MCILSKDDTEESSACRYEEILIEFQNLALNRFEWGGLPTGLTSERMEFMLMEKGQLMGFKKTENNQVMILPADGTQDINSYGEFDKYIITGYAGYIQTVDIEKGVRIKNNL